MTKNAIAFSERYLEIAFTPQSLSWNWKIRNKIFKDLFNQYELTRYVDIVEPEPVAEEELLLVHDSEFIEYVKKKSKTGIGYLDYGDTPAYKGVYEDAILVVGGTAKLVKLILKGEYKKGFNPQGGFHHAQKGTAAGFCVFNDVALAAMLASREKLRVAVVDIDGHHGDGTQFILYDKPLLKISFHRYGYFYPGTGDINELGEGVGYGYSVNIPLPSGAGDDVFEMALNEVVIPLLEYYKPEFIVAQMGVDGHLGDPLVDLRLTSKSYRLIGQTLRYLAEKYAQGRVIGLGGGGYDPDNTSRMWMIMISEIFDIPEELRRKIYEELRDKPEGTLSTEQVVKTVKYRIERLKKNLRKAMLLPI